MVAAGCIRSVFRSSALRSAIAKLTSSPTKPPTSACTVLSSKQTPRFLRRPVEMSFCVESFLPLHSATASARLTSMLASSRPGFGWLIDVGGVEIVLCISMMSTAKRHRRLVTIPRVYMQKKPEVMIADA